jgi:hypothetical protein
MPRMNTQTEHITEIGVPSNKSLVAYLVIGCVIIAAMLSSYIYIFGGLIVISIGFIFIIIHAILYPNVSYIDKIKRVWVYEKKIIPFEDIKTLFVLEGYGGESGPNPLYIMALLKNKTFLKVHTSGDFKYANSKCLKLCDEIKVPCSNNNEGKIDFSYIINYALKESGLKISNIHTIVGDKSFFYMKVTIKAIMKDNSHKNLIDITGIEFHNDILGIADAIRNICKSNHLANSYDSNRKLIRKNLRVK